MLTQESVDKKQKLLSNQELSLYNEEITSLEKKKKLFRKEIWLLANEINWLQYNIELLEKELPNTRLLSTIKKINKKKMKLIEKNDKIFEIAYKLSEADDKIREVEKIYRRRLKSIQAEQILTGTFSIDDKYRILKEEIKNSNRETQLVPMTSICFIRAVDIDIPDFTQYSELLKTTKLDVLEITDSSQIITSNIVQHITKIKKLQQNSEKTTFLLSLSYQTPINYGNHAVTMMLKFLPNKKLQIYLIDSHGMPMPQSLQTLLLKLFSDMKEIEFRSNNLEYQISDTCAALATMCVASLNNLENLSDLEIQKLIKGFESELLIARSGGEYTLPDRLPDTLPGKKRKFLSVLNYFVKHKNKENKKEISQVVQSHYKEKISPVIQSQYKTYQKTLENEELKIPYVMTKEETFFNELWNIKMSPSELLSELESYNTHIRSLNDDVKFEKTTSKIDGVFDVEVFKFREQLKPQTKLQTQTTEQLTKPKSLH